MTTATKTTAQEAASHADRKARETGQDYFVVTEAGKFDIVAEAEIDTYYCGIPENDVLYHTSEGWY